MIKETLLLLAAVSASAPAPQQSKTINGVRYGEPEIISGIWFTNFENSRFLECKVGKCDSQSLTEWASIACVNGACEALDRAARRITQNKKRAMPEGVFRIRFLGRRGLTRHQSRFIGDGQLDVLVERVLDVRKAKAG